MFQTTNQVYFQDTQSTNSHVLWLAADNLMLRSLTDMSFDMIFEIAILYLGKLQYFTKLN